MPALQVRGQTIRRIWPRRLLCNSRDSAVRSRPYAPSTRADWAAPEVAAASRRGSSTFLARVFTLSHLGPAAGEPDPCREQANFSSLNWDFVRSWAVVRPGRFA